MVYLIFHLNQTYLKLYLMKKEDKSITLIYPEQGMFQLYNEPLEFQPMKYQMKEKL